MSIYDTSTVIGEEFALTDLPAEKQDRIREALNTARVLGYAFLLGWDEDAETFWIGAIKDEAKP